MGDRLARDHGEEYLLLRAVLDTGNDDVTNIPTADRTGAVADRTQLAWAGGLAFDRHRVPGAVFESRVEGEGAIGVDREIIAAIVLTMRKRPETKYQNPAQQVAVKAKDRVRIVEMKAEEKDS